MGLFKKIKKAIKSVTKKVTKPVENIAKGAWDIAAAPFDATKELVTQGPSRAWDEFTGDMERGGKSILKGGLQLFDPTGLIVGGSESKSAVVNYTPAAAQSAAAPADSAGAAIGGVEEDWATRQRGGASSGSTLGRLRVGGL